MICEICREAMDKSDVIEVGDQIICAACKPAFLRQLKEGTLEWTSRLRMMSETELSLVSIFDLSWKVFCRDWFKMVVLIVAVTIPMHFILMRFDYGESANVREIVRYFRMNQLLENVIGVIGTLGIAYVVQERTSGRRATVAGTFAHAMRRWLPGAWTELVASIAVGLLSLAFIIPGVIWFVYYSFIASVVALRDRSGSRALDYSKRLVRGRWWRVAGKMLALFAVAAVPSIVIAVGIGFLPQAPWLDLLSSVLVAVPFAFSSAGTTVLFLNLDAIADSPPARATPSSTIDEKPSEKSAPVREYDY